jgi:hypothetical protein
MVFTAGDLCAQSVGHERGRLRLASVPGPCIVVAAHIVLSYGGRNRQGLTAWFRAGALGDMTFGPGRANADG